MSRSLSFILKNYPPAVDRFLSDQIGALMHQAAVKEVADPAMYSLMAGGKRIRPLSLLLAAGVTPVNDGGEILEFNPETYGYRALLAGSAIECIHTYSLIHDDLPAMDDDDLRRGRPSCHKAYSEWAAILAGDALNTFAFRLLTDAVDPKESHMLGGLVRVLSEAAGISGMICGQALDLRSEKDEKFRRSQNQEELLLEIHNKKTAAMMAAGFEMGAILSGVSDTSGYRKFGLGLGLLFQITDDILDVVSDTETLGKTAGKDEKSGKLTYPALYGLEESRKKASRLSEELKGIAGGLPAGPHMEIDMRSAIEELPSYIEKRIN